MKYSMISILIAFSAFTFVFSEDAPTNGGKAPMIKGEDLGTDAGDISLKLYAGKVVLINFWATWCPPCRGEIPDLIKLQKVYKGKLEVFSVSVDQNGPDKVREFSKKYGINYPVIMSDDGIVRSYGGIEAIPTTFLVDTNGNLVKKYVGSMTFDQYEAEIKPFLPE